MLNNINELIEINLARIANAHNYSLFRTDFVNENGRSMHSTSERLADFMESKGLINIEPTKRFRCDLTEFGLAVSQNGGWKKYLEVSEMLHENERIENDYKSKLELALAESNLEANKLNKKIAEQNQENEKKNQISTWINIGIGIINIGLLIWQILKSK